MTAGRSRQQQHQTMTNTSFLHIHIHTYNMHSPGSSQTRQYVRTWTQSYLAAYKSRRSPNVINKHKESQASSRKEKRRWAKILKILARVLREQIDYLWLITNNNYLPTYDISYVYKCTVYSSVCHGFNFDSKVVTRHNLNIEQHNWTDHDWPHKQIFGIYHLFFFLPSARDPGGENHLFLGMQKFSDGDRSNPLQIIIKVPMQIYTTVLFLAVTLLYHRYMSKLLFDSSNCDSNLSSDSD
jgi:hypothetical protein